ncbi:unnamed protein product [Cyprideis torosa]|uniref:Uncharacterized protein n=1 Tax=Cyprideis torosa TaxID=163714 RepID=A0A7R8W1E4_9CRUS|nr:unnamed protein product [Cyprideis torosa]CAG0880806.1 unnamed protein product [Cyprideis torosa]
MNMKPLATEADSTTEFEGKVMSREVASMTEEDKSRELIKCCSEPKEMSSESCPLSPEEPALQIVVDCPSPLPPVSSATVLNAIGGSGRRKQFKPQRKTGAGPTEGEPALRYRRAIPRRIMIDSAAGFKSMLILLPELFTFAETQWCQIRRRKCWPECLRVQGEKQISEEVVSEGGRTEHGVPQTVLNPASEQQRFSALICPRDKADDYPPLPPSVLDSPFASLCNRRNHGKIPFNCSPRSPPKCGGLCSVGALAGSFMCVLMKGSVLRKVTKKLAFAQPEIAVTNYGRKGMYVLWSENRFPVVFDAVLLGSVLAFVYLLRRSILRIQSTWPPSFHSENPIHLASISWPPSFHSENPIHLASVVPF